MKRVSIVLLAAIVAASMVGTVANPLPDGGHVSLQPSKTSSSCANPTPFVIPSLQEWKGSKGEWQLSKATRIVIDPAYARGIPADTKNTFMANPANLQQYAASFQLDIKQVTGLDLQVVVSNKYSKNDIFLTL
ncbi:hypothetical protein GGF38_005367, partial [Coemansia sp. RSA 25]